MAFEDLWERRQVLDVAPGVGVALPTVDDLIQTKPGEGLVHARRAYRRWAAARDR